MSPAHPCYSSSLHKENKRIKKFGGLNESRYLCTAIQNRLHRVCVLGEMVEWSITPVLKTGVLRGTGGSNPSLSATSLKFQ